VELDEDGRPSWHVVIAQLHYTTLLHLARVFELRRRCIRDRDSFIEAIARLHAATDTAFELLGRCLLNQDAPECWNESPPETIRGRWISEKEPPLKPLRDYRNILLHGRLEMSFLATLKIDADGRRYTKAPFFPSFETASKTPDWREANSDDAVAADQLVNKGWDQVLSYFRQTWDDELLKWADQHFEAPERPPQKVTFEIVGSAHSLSAEGPYETPAGSAVSSDIRVLPPVDE
jgi:hypothetical protein